MRFVSFILFLGIFSGFSNATKTNFTDRKYCISGVYYVNSKNNGFILEVSKKSNNEIQYFKYKKGKFERFPKNKLDDNFKIIYWNDENKLDEKYKFNKITKKRYSSYVEIEKDKYIISIYDEIKGVDELFYFINNKITKIELKNIYAFINYNESFMYFDKEKNNLYFPGNKIKKKGSKRYDYGIYIYNLRTKKITLFHKAKLTNINCPFKIPGTNKIIMIDHITIQKEPIKIYDEVIIKDRQE